MAWVAPSIRATGDLITAAGWNQDIVNNELATFPAGSTYTAYTPAITTFNVGSGTVTPTLGSGSTAVGRYLQIGKTVMDYGIVVFGSSGTSAGTGGYLISLPVTAAGAGINRIVGSCQLIDSSSGNIVLPVGLLYDATHMYMQYPATAPISGAISVTESFPWVWGNNDQLLYMRTFEAA